MLWDGNFQLVIRGNSVGIKVDQSLIIRDHVLGFEKVQKLHFDSRSPNPTRFLNLLRQFYVVATFEAFSFFFLLLGIERQTE